MTHPDGGGGGTSGPGRSLSANLDFTRRGHERSIATAADAGAHTTSAAPLRAEQREDRYRKQTGSRRTARQRRRIVHKANRSLAMSGPPRPPAPVPPPPHPQPPTN
ncbi:hypothetical protein C1I95_20370 [Micromonospora craterilacus]|uniref:Uncharacterized protein n=1 Tax=Micromonospora craterilacus TaxID=1655439 RepID=A0A2W2EDM1_9ACTN|nr:hypothetical protein C1I95_20370 [Micromonospora craterilacus]